MKKKSSVYIDEELLEQAKKLEINLSEVITEILEKAVKKKRCPTCGSLIKR